MSKSPSSTERLPLQIGIRSALLILVAMATIVISEGFEPAHLVFPGSRGVGGDVMIADFGSETIPDRYAYDGQPLYVLAREFPDLAAAGEQGVADFRMNRGLQAALASVGGSGSTLVALLALWGVVGVGLGAGALADLAQRYGRDARVGYAAPIAFAFPAVITTTEPLAFGLGLLGIALADRDRLVWAAVAIGLAGLGRETALAMALAVALTLFARRRLLAGAAFLVASALPFFAWSTYVGTQVPENTDQIVQLFGFLHLPSLGPTDYIVSLAAVALMVAGVVGWRDVPVLAITAGLFLGACALYIGDQWRFHGLIRVSSGGVAIGIAAVLAWTVFRTGSRREPRSTSQGRKLP